MKLSKKRIFKLASAVVLTAVIFTMHASTAMAAFNQNKIIDDFIFNNKDSMNAGQIDAFLNARSSCISQNSGFSAVDPIGYSPSSGYQFGGNVSAGTVIYHAAQAYDINPQVIMTTLQKEQSLLTATSCSTTTLAQTLGYGCLDGSSGYNYSNVNLYTRNGTTYTSVSNTCVNSSVKAGFSQQIIRAAWLLKFGQQRSLGNTGWAIVRGNWNNSDDLGSCYGGPMTEGIRKTCPNGTDVYYDGYRTIDGVSVHMDTGGTAALYWYTPHLHGNQVFVAVFESYFGPTAAPFYAASYFSQSSYPTIAQGQQTTVTLQYRNDGNLPWYDYAASGPTTPPVVLATSNPTNRGSEFFTTGWTSPSRPARNFTAVYEADGVTLAANQHVVQPGQVGRYDVAVQAPKDLYPGTYQEYFMPIREGASGFSWFMGGDTVHMDITVTRANSATFTGQSAYPNLAQNEKSSMYFTFKNSGSANWYDSTTAAANGDYPIVLAGMGPVNRASDFATTGWSSVSRPAINFSKVFEADGVTLAANQHVVQPGQVARFDINITAKITQNPGTYREYFGLLREGARDWLVDGSGAYQDVTVRGGTIRAGYVGQAVPPSIAKGQSGTMSYRLKNTGSIKWYDDASWSGGLYVVHFATSWPVNRGSIFNGQWASSSRPQVVFSKVYEADNATLAADQHQVIPGQIAEFAFPITVPANAASGTYQEHFQPVLEYAPWFSWWMDGMVWQNVVVP